jgi:uncharacterized protein YjbJ (UPF0337 family)
MFARPYQLQYACGTGVIVYEERIAPMNRIELEGKMRQLRGKMKAKWARLTDDDMALLEAQIDQMVGVLQERYGSKPGQARADLEKYMRDYNEQAQKLFGKTVERVQDMFEDVEAPSRNWIWGGLAVMILSVVLLINRNR